MPALSHPRLPSLLSLSLLLVACGPGSTDSTTSEGSATTQATSDTTGATGTGTSGPCVVPPDADASEAQARTLRVVNGREAAVYLDVYWCTRRVVHLTGDAPVPAEDPRCGPSCAHILEHGQPVSPCGHCGNELLRLEPGGVYEEAWAGLLYEDVTLDTPCVDSETPCGRAVIPTSTLQAEVHVGEQLDCDHECECEPDEDGACWLLHDVFVSDGATLTYALEPDGPATVQLVIE